MSHKPLHEEEREGFTIRFYALPEDMSPVGHFDSGNTDHDKEIIEKIATGDLTWFVAKVTASKCGVELGTDYLGGCCYDSEKDFYTKYKDDYYADMVKSAIKEAKETLKCLNQ